MNIIFINNELVRFERIETVDTLIKDINGHFLNRSSMRHYSYNGFSSSADGRIVEPEVYLGAQYGYCYKTHTLLFYKCTEKLYLVHPDYENHPAKSVIECVKREKIIALMSQDFLKELCKQATVLCESPNDIERLGILLMNGNLSSSQILLT